MYFQCFINRKGMGFKCNFDLGCLFLFFFLHLRYMYICICDLFENVFNFKLPYASKLTVTNFQSLVFLFYLAISNKLKRIVKVSFFLLNSFFHNVFFCVHIVFLCVCLLKIVWKQFHAQAFIINFCHLQFMTQELRQYCQISKTISENTQKINL